MASGCIVRQSPNEHQSRGGTEPPSQGSPFDGFDPRSMTPVPNQVFDELLPGLPEAELKVLLYVARHTLGYGRPEAPLSLDPFLGGTTTSDEGVGRGCTVIDRAARMVALGSLLERGLIAASEGPLGVDGNATVVYRLRFSGGLLGPGPGDPSADCVRRNHIRSRGEASGEAGEADREDDIARVVGPLVDFGLSQQAARHLAHKFPGPYILEKLSQVKAMVEAGSPLVSRNPQGYLRRAIEEDYASPQRFGTAGVEAGPLGEAPGPEREEEPRPTPRRGSGEELDRVWQRALAFLRSRVSRSNYEVWLQDTVLLEVGEGEALVGSPTDYQRDWLEGRMGSLVKSALAEVLGHDVEVAFATFDSSGGADEKP